MTNSTTGERGSRVVIVGALSAIAEAAARRWAEAGAYLVLAARDADRLNAVAADLRAYGATVETFAADLATADAGALLAGMSKDGPLDVVLVAYGLLGDQQRAERDPGHAQEIMAVNFTSAANWCLAAANVLEAQRHGALIVVGSVAGDRGRASNYVYGAAKGGIAVLVQGLAHRLSRSGARAVLIKPGFVDTPMTAHITPKGALWAKPDDIARVIVAAGDVKRSGPIVYAPWFWRWIMVVIRSLPSFVLHRTKL